LLCNYSLSVICRRKQHVNGFVSSPAEHRRGPARWGEPQREVFPSRSWPAPRLWRAHAVRASHGKPTRGRAAETTAIGGLAADDIAPTSDELPVSRHPFVVHSCPSVVCDRCTRYELWDRLCSSKTVAPCSTLCLASNLEEGKRIRRSTSNTTCPSCF